MINNFSSQKIQKDLFILTGYKYSISYINKTIKRIFKEIILSKKKNNKYSSISKYIPLSRSYFKLWEILTTFENKMIFFNKKFTDI